MNNYDQVPALYQDRLDEDGELMDEDEDYGGAEEEDGLSKDEEEDEM